MSELTVSENGLLGDVTNLEVSLEILVRRVQGRLFLTSDQRMPDVSDVTNPTTDPVTVIDLPTSVQMSVSELRKIVREEMEMALNPLKTSFSPIRMPGSRFSSVEGIAPFDISEVGLSQGSPAYTTDFDQNEFHGENYLKSMF